MKGKRARPKSGGVRGGREGWSSGWVARMGKLTQEGVRDAGAGGVADRDYCATDGGRLVTD